MGNFADTELLTTGEAAFLLDLSPSTLTTWRSDPSRAPLQGGPPFTRVGRGPRAPVRYRRSALLAWQEARARS